MARAADDRVRLLHGPYWAPRLRKGDQASCLFRDCEVIVTGWTDARIAWPRCRPLDVPRTHPSLLVDEELARAVRTESAAAVRYWWGVSVAVVWKWRRALGVTRTNNPGVRLAHAARAVEVEPRVVPADDPLHAVPDQPQLGLQVRQLRAGVRIVQSHNVLQGCGVWPAR
jgi:hypothetical protein